MLKSLKTIATLSLFPTRILPFLSLHLFTRSIAPFCSIPNHPVILNLLEVQHQEDLEEPLVEIAKLNDQNKQIALKIILQGIKDKNFSPRVLVHDKFAVYIKKFPALHVQALLFRIEMELKELERFMSTNKEEGKKIAVKDINNCFTMAFDALKKVPKSEALTLQIQACRQFAIYHHKYLLRLIDPKRGNQVLKKSLQFYKSALTKIVNLIEQQQEKATKEGENKIPDQTLLKGDDLNEEDMEKIEKSIEFKRFVYAEDYCELLYKILQVQNYLTDPRIKETPRPRSKLVLPFQYHVGLYPLIPDFAKAISLYDKIEEKLESRFYFKIKKSYLELQHYENLHLNKHKPEYEEKEIPEFNQRMEDLIAEIVNGFVALPYEEETIEIQESLCLLLLGIKSNKLSRMQLEEQQFEAQLLAQVTSILDIIKDKDLRKLISANFCHAIKTVMNLDFQKYLGRLPRNTRYQGRRQRN